MSKQFVRKNIKLSRELDKYLLSHPKRFEQIPSGSYIVITSKDDPKFSEENISLVRQSRTKREIIEARKTSAGWRIKPLAVAS